MAIQIAALKAIAERQARSWLACPPPFDGVELLVALTTAEDTREFLGMQDGAKAREVPDDEWRDWCLDKVHDWRGVLDGDDAAPFDRSALAGFWPSDVFRAWLIEECRNVATFLGCTQPAVALEVGASSE